MVLSEVARRIAQQHPEYENDTIKQCTRIIVSHLDESLVMGRAIQIRGFGTFSLHRRAARIARDPRNGAAVRLPETYIPHFKVSPKLRDSVRQHDAVIISPISRKPEV